MIDGKMRTTTAVLLSLVTVAACGPSDDLALDDRFGAKAVLVVENRETLWSDSTAWSVVPDPLVTIGRVHGPAHYQLFDIASATRQADGDIVLVDRGTREVRLYEPDGTFVKTLGGPGAGPGEFQEPAQVLVTDTDAILVWDNANYRITRFDAAGDLAGVQSVDRNGLAQAIDPPLYPWTAGLLSDGQVVVRLLEKTGKAAKSGITRPRSGALKVSADLSQVDTLMFFSGVEQVGVRAPWGLTPIEPPLAKSTLIAFQPTAPRTCIGEQEQPEVVCFGPGVKTVAIRWISDASAVTNQEIATWRDTTIEMYTQKMSEADALLILDEVAPASNRPYYTRLVLDRGGYLWVERAPVNWSDPESVEYLVFDPEGVLLGTVVVPPLDVLEIGDDYVLGIFRDEVEVEYVHVYTIVRPLLQDTDM